jgi:hypothetical protein
MVNYPIQTAMVNNSNDKKYCKYIRIFWIDTAFDKAIVDVR